MGKLPVIALLLAAWAVRSEDYFAISGTIKLISYSGEVNGSVQDETQRSYSFKCIVGTNEWRIDHTFIPNWEEAWYFDGTNVYHTLQPGDAMTTAAATGSLARSFPVPQDNQLVSAISANRLQSSITKKLLT